MLVITRHPSEKIIFGNNLIIIKVLEISGKSVRLGIEAPEELSVHREEIYNRIKAGIPKPCRHSKDGTISSNTITDSSIGGNN